MKEYKEEVARDAENLRQVMEGKQRAKEANTTKLVTNTRMLPKLPRDSRMIAKDGILTKGKSKGSGSSFVSGAMRFSEGSRTKLSTGASVLLRAKREAKEIGRMNKLLTPMGKIGARSSVVQKAPQAMVDQHRREAIPGPQIVVPRKSSGLISRRAASGGVTNQFGRITESELEKRERRLKAIKEGRSVEDQPSGRPTVIDTGDDDDDDGDDDVFSDNQSPSSPPTAVRPAPPKKLFKQARSTAAATPVIRRESGPASKTNTASIQESRKSPIHTVAPPRPADKPLSPISRTSSPAAGARPPGTPSQGPLKRKKTVDIFNRGGAATKKPKIMN